VISWIVVSFSADCQAKALIGIDFLNLFINQRKYALPDSEDQAISLLHVIFEPEAALSSLIQQAFNSPPLILQNPTSSVPQLDRAG
jgi:hypothetical protein